MIEVSAAWHDAEQTLVENNFKTTSVNDVLRQIEQYPWQNESDYFATHQEGFGLQCFRENAAHKLEILLMPDSDNLLYLLAFYEAKTGGFLGLGRKKRKWDTGVITIEQAKQSIDPLLSTPLDRLLQLPK